MEKPKRQEVLLFLGLEFAFANNKDKTAIESQKKKKFLYIRTQ